MAKIQNPWQLQPIENFYTWNLNLSQPHESPNPAHPVDFLDNRSCGDFNSKTMTAAIVSLISGIIALYCAIELYKHLRGEIFRLNDSVNELDNRLAKMEQAQQKRINYRSLEEIENAMAELVVYKMDLNNKIERIDSVISHLSKAHTPKTTT